MSLLFRVAMFLRDEKSLTYDLIPSDISILFLLASHIGEREYWYISQPDIATECRIKVTQFRRRCKKLETQKLITVKRTGKANGYGISLPYPFSDDRYSSTEQGVDNSQPKNHDRSSSTDQIGTTVPIRSVLEGRHKETLNKLKKTERGRTKRASPLSGDFLPNDESVMKAQDVGLTEDEANDQFEIFMNHFLDNGKAKHDWQLALRTWFIKAGEYKRKNPGKQKKEPEQVRSTVPFYEPRDTTERRGDPNVMQSALKNIMSQLKGGRTNGLGSQGEGKKGGRTSKA